MELWNLGTWGELWKCEVEKYGGVNRGEGVETSYFFNWVGRNGTLCVPDVFITFKRTKFSQYFTLREREKHNLSKLKQVFCGLFSILSDYPWAKIKYIGATPTVVSLVAVVWSCHTTPSIPCWRESHYCVTRPNNGCGRDCAYSRSSSRKKIKIIRIQLVASKI